jgi:hypothetical protein
LAVFTPRDILKWADGNQTALCPVCGIDAVLPDGDFGGRVTKELLEAMQDRWFGESAK